MSFISVYNVYIFKDSRGGGSHHPAGGAEPGGQHHSPPTHLIRQAQGHTGQQNLNFNP